MDRSILQSLDKETLIDLLLEQGKIIEELRSQLKEANQRIATLERASKRQAAPFRIDETKKKKDKKSPGNKLGHKGYYRKFSGQIDERIEVPLEKCPICEHSEFKEVRPIEQIVEEVEAKTHVTKLITYEAICTHCQHVVSSHHPLKISNAKGAASTYIGPKAKSLALKLNFEYGLSKRKTVGVMEKIFGIKISPGGLTHASHKAAQVLEPRYEQLKQLVQSSKVIHADETSWYVSDPKYWLWVFANKNLTLYHVIKSRAREVIYSILGKDYQGVLVSDCLSIYDDVNKHQQKCYSHHLKAISIAEQLIRNSEKDRHYLNQIKVLLKRAIILKKIKNLVINKQYEGAITHLQNEADHLLQDPINTGFQQSTLSVLNRLSKQKDHLFTFMKYDQVDATNNLAERKLRPAVIARKISCGNKTEKGANTWQILSSLIQTFIQQGKSFDHILTNSYYQSF